MLLFLPGRVFYDNWNIYAKFHILRLCEFSIFPGTIRLPPLGEGNLIDAQTNSR
jgi:hypothetical protein